MQARVFRNLAVIACFLGVFFASTVEAQSLTAVQSRKAHPSAGTHDLEIDTTQSIGGAVTVDPRAIGSGHTVVFQFDAPAVAPASVTVVDAQGAPIGVVGAPITSGTEVTVDLTGIPDNSRVTVSLRDGTSTVYATASMGFLLGDVNSTHGVDSSDVSAVKTRSGLPAGGTTFRYDVGVSGLINASDISVVKSRLGQVLVPVGQAMLSLAKAGTGLGSVSASGILATLPANISCSDTCFSTSAFFDANTTVTLTAMASTGSTFSGWSGPCASGSINLVTNASCNATFTANVYNVTPSAGANGSISPSTVQTAIHGSTLAFTVTPNATFGATVGGTCGGNLVGTTFTTDPITGPCTVAATFAPATFAVTPSSGPDGVINPSTVQNVAVGGTATFTVTPNANFAASVDGTCGGTLLGSNFTTDPVTVPCTVSASFTRTSHEVTPIAGPNGSINPSTVQVVNNGATATFTVTPNAGYAAVVGVDATCGGALVGTTFTTDPITGLCAVVVNFVSINAYYVSTTGNDTTGNGSIGNPWKTIGFAIGRMVSGDTLIVRNGVYTGLANFIKHPPSGTPSRYTTIVAESPMDVRIQSTVTLGYDDKQVFLSGNYIKVDGFIFDMSGTSYPPYIGTIDGNYNKLTRSIFKRSGNIDAYGGLLTLNGNDNLVEDTAGVGACRYCFKQGGTTQITQRNIFRRVVARFDYSNSAQPKATFSTYGNDSVATNGVFDHLYQNVIAVDGQNPGKNGGEEKYGGFLTVKAATNVRVQGSMVLNEGVGYSGMHLRDYATGTANVATHSVVWNLPGSNAGAIGIKGFAADHVTIGGSVPAAAHNLTNGTPTASLLKPAVPPANLLNNTPGAVILKRYGVTGTRWGEPGYDQLTTEDLWPWVYQDKIKAVFREVNNVPAGNNPATNDTQRGFSANGNGLYGGPITLTSYIWEMTGTPCPPTVCF